MSAEGGARSTAYRRYLAMAVVDALGSGAYLPLAAIVLTVLVGIPVVEVGLVLTLSTVVGLVVTPGAAPLVARYGPSAVTTVSLAVRAGSVLGYLFTHGFVAALLLTTAGRVASQLARPSLVLLARAVAAEPVRLLATSRAWRNVGMALGSATVAVALLNAGRVGYVAVVCGNAASYLAAAVLVPRLPIAAVGAEAAARPERNRPRLSAVFADGAFSRCAAAAGLLAVQASVLTVALPLWLVERAESRSSLAAAALTVNTALVALLQVRVSRRAEEAAGALRMMRISGLLLAVACVGPAVLTAGPAVVGAVAWLAVVLTMGEIASSAGAWGASLGLAPAEGAEQHLTVFAWAESAGEAISPLVATALVVRLTGGWLALALVFVAGAALVPAAGRYAAEERDADVTPAGRRVLWRARRGTSG